MWSILSMAEYLGHLQKTNDEFISESVEKPVFTGWVLKPMPGASNFSIHNLKSFSDIVSEAKQYSEGIICITSRIVPYSDDEVNVYSSKIRVINENILVQLIYGIRCKETVFDIHLWRIGRPNGMLTWHSTLWIMKMRRELSNWCFDSKVESTVRGTVCMPEDGLDVNIKEQRLKQFYKFLTASKRVTKQHVSKEHMTPTVSKILIKLKYISPSTLSDNTQNLTPLQRAIEVSKKLSSKYEYKDRGKEPPPIDKKDLVTIWRPYHASLFDSLHWGGSLLAGSEEATSKLNISRYIRFGTDYTGGPSGPKYQICIPVLDNRSMAPIYSACLVYLVAYLKKILENGEKVLVYCFEGVSRSCSLIIAYQIAINKTRWTDAMSHASDLRPCSNPNIGYLQVLANFDKTVRSGDVADIHVLRKIIKNVYAFQPVYKGTPIYTDNLYIITQKDKNYIYIPAATPDGVCQSVRDLVDEKNILIDIYKDFISACDTIGVEICKDTTFDIYTDFMETSGPDPLEYDFGSDDVDNYTYIEDKKGINIDSYIGLFEYTNLFC